MTVKIAVAFIVAISALLAVGVVSANPETTDERAGFDGNDFLVGSLREPTLTATVTPTDTPDSTATPTPTLTATATPPVSNEYVEPEYIRLATAAISTHPELQAEIWGRDLWGDEVDSVGRGTTAWITTDFERRCMLPDGQVAAALEVVKERIPNAEYRYNQSQPSYFSLRFGQQHRWFTDRLTTSRTVDTLYSYIDDNGKIRWIDTEVKTNVLDCSVTKLAHFIKANEPTIWRGDAPELESRKTPPLQPFDVESGDPSQIICRRNCE